MTYNQMQDTLIDIAREVQGNWINVVVVYDGYEYIVIVDGVTRTAS